MMGYYPATEQRDRVLEATTSSSKKDFVTLSMPSSRGESPSKSNISDGSAGLLESTLGRLKVDMSRGLGLQQVQIRREEYGPNELTHKSKGTGEGSWISEDVIDIMKQYAEQFQNPLILLLIGSAVISLLLGQLENAISIALAVLLVCTVGFVQEYRTEKSLEALNKLAPPRCRVLRDGILADRLASELVPGDVVELALGDRVPADLLLTEAVGLELDESMMTGESEGRAKAALHPGVWPDHSRGGIDNRNSNNADIHTALMGTLVRAGRGRGIVIATGLSTELGRLFKLVEETQEKKSPLQISLDGLGHQLTLYSGIVIVVIGLIGLLQGRPLLEIFTVGVSLAVAAIPEGLPVVATVTLALGVLRLARRKVIVRQLPAVEALGAVTIVCADKTGTLTTNELSLQAICTADGQIHLVSEGNSIPRIADLLRVATGCNNATRHDGQWMGNAVDVALMRFAQAQGYAPPSVPRVSEKPFSSDTRFMAVDTGSEYMVKGAGEVVAEMLLASGQAQQASSLLRLEAEMHTKGLRTLALASGPAADRLAFVGLLGLMDPPRPGIGRTLADLRAAHLRIIMVTGDAKDTAMALAKAVGFPAGEALSGSDLVRLLDSPDFSPSRLQDISIVYRALPQHKLRLVQALQLHLNAVVAMTGDGVNDAPALKMADIGIAMGKSGTDVARQAAKLILTEDNLEALLDGIHEGKAIFANIRHFIRFQLATSLAALGLIALSSFVPGASGAPPLNAMQILLINIIMDGPPAQCLGVEPIDPEVLTRPPRARDAPILSAGLLTRTALSAAYVLLGCLSVFAWEVATVPEDRSRTFTVFVLFSLFNAFSCRSLDQSVFRLGLLKNRALNISLSVAFCALLAILYSPVLERIFQTTALPLREFGGLLALASSVLFFDELVKAGSAWLASRSTSSKGYIPLY